MRYRPTVLVTGGTGFVGSQLMQTLRAHHYHPITFSRYDKRVIQADLLDKNSLEDIFKRYSFQAVFHLAGSKSLTTSITNPHHFYENNLIATLNLLEIMQKFKANNLIFASTASVYGEAQYAPMDPSHPKQPLTAYGQSKWMIEQILEEYSTAYGLRYATLRYFNIAGFQAKATHFVPLIFEVLAGKRAGVDIYGDDHATEDGTTTRDYVEISDLCSAHILALEQLIKSGKNAIYNLGHRHTYSVKQIIQTAEKLSGKIIPFRILPKRVGEVSFLSADANLTRSQLGWQPKHITLESMLLKTWRTMRECATRALELT